MGKVIIGEWLWRFLAAVMVFAVAWSMWIFYQLNPSPLITNEAFAAAAKANARQNAQGVIAPAVVSALPLEPKEPPINADKLKYSEVLSIPEKK